MTTRAASSPGSVRDSAYATFQQALLDRRLRPGQIVSQRDLVSLMSLSIGALRELLPRLESEGLLTVIPQRGIQITAIDIPLIRDTFQMRAALEREAVLHAVRHLPDAALTRQRDLHERIIAACRTAPDEALLAEGQKVDTGFHMLLVDFTDNDLIRRAYEVNMIRMRLIKLDRIRLNHLVLPEAFGDHLAVIDAILARDETAAMRAMDRHILNARTRAMEL